MNSCLLFTSVSAGLLYVKVISDFHVKIASVNWLIFMIMIIVDHTHFAWHDSLCYVFNCIHLSFCVLFMVSAFSGDQLTIFMQTDSFVDHVHLVGSIHPIPQ